MAFTHYITPVSDEEKERVIAEAISQMSVAGFFHGDRSDNRMRMFEQIIEWSDEQIERSHDMIQWLFPLKDPSWFNPDAPILDDTEIMVMKSDKRIMTNLRRAFRRFMMFLGMDVDYIGHGGIKVIKETNWQERSKTWITLKNHNFLRITRVLLCMRLFELDEFADALYAALEGIYHVHYLVIGEKTWHYWSAAVKG